MSGTSDLCCVVRSTLSDDVVLPTDPNEWATLTWADEFGNSIALDGNLALVGARKANAPGGDSGSAYLFDTMNTERMIDYAKKQFL